MAVVARGLGPCPIQEGPAEPEHVPVSGRDPAASVHPPARDIGVRRAGLRHVYHSSAASILYSSRVCPSWPLSSSPTHVVFEPVVPATEVWRLRLHGGAGWTFRLRPRSWPLPAQCTGVPSAAAASRRGHILCCLFRGPGTKHRRRRVARRCSHGHLSAAPPRGAFPCPPAPSSAALLRSPL